MTLSLLTYYDISQLGIHEKGKELERVFIEMTKSFCCILSCPMLIEVIKSLMGQDFFYYKVVKVVLPRLLPVLNATHLEVGTTKKLCPIHSFTYSSYVESLLCARCSAI